MSDDAETKSNKIGTTIEEGRKNTTPIDRNRQNGALEGNAQNNITPKDHPPTNYLQTLIHVLKGNIGPGLFAMGDAFKNGGYIISPILTIIIAVISIHCQHVLIKCSEKMRQIRDLPECADYAETVEQCFEEGPPKLKKFSKIMKTIVNIFICVTQLGFCCIYIVFMSTNIKQILDVHDININIHYIMALTIIPTLLPSLITNLKWLTPVSMIANLCMFTGISVTLYFALRDGVPTFEGRDAYTDSRKLALFFGTAIFAFEGIALVLPLKNAMRKPSDFEKTCGVLNVGMVLVTTIFTFTGFVGYLKWGQEVGGSLTLNLGDTVLAQCVKAVVSTGVLLGYALQFFVAIQIMWPSAQRQCHCSKRPLLGELLFRTTMVVVTVAIAELVPALGLFISLIGALCSTALALVFPPMIEMIVRRSSNRKGPGAFILSKNIIILCFALLGFTTGTIVSLSEIIKHFGRGDFK